MVYNIYSHIHKLYLTNKYVNYTNILHFIKTYNIYVNKEFLKFLIRKTYIWYIDSKYKKIHVRILQNKMTYENLSYYLKYLNFFLEFVSKNY